MMMCCLIPTCPMPWNDHQTEHAFCQVKPCLNLGIVGNNAHMMTPATATVHMPVCTPQLALLTCLHNIVRHPYEPASWCAHWCVPIGSPHMCMWHCTAPLQVCLMACAQHHCSPTSACTHLLYPHLPACIFPCLHVPAWACGWVFFFFFFPFLLVFMTICTCLHTSGCTSLCPLAPTHLTCMHDTTWHSQVHLMAHVPHHLTCPHRPESLVQATLHGTLTGLPHGTHTTPPDLPPSAHTPVAVASTTAPPNVHVPHAGLCCTPPPATAPSIPCIDP